ncbi:calmodulin-binding transcription activator 3-like [Tasmannia lanceolata]|uniref:calmodulin-binding transcription activator 3-like n=1 Tax=Tasmannia lanceolata TaxID=3420 RepID=UPI004063BA74
MAESRRYGLHAQLDMEQILLEAQARWLRPAEICEILRNYQKFRIAPEPPNRPPSGSLFLFDRKVLRYFRKDGHNWRKKKDGKTVKEAHERLKAGSVDVLHCYYAHGEDNENFQRRSYWMLEEEFMHIVLVHYREVKGNRTSFGHNRDSEEISQSPQMGSPVSSNFLTNHNHLPSQTTDTSSLNNAQTSDYEDTEYGDNNQASSRYDSFLELQQSEDRPEMNQMDAGFLNNYFPVTGPSNQCDYQGKQSNIPGLSYLSVGRENGSRGINDTGFGSTFHEPSKHDVTSWEGVFEHFTPGSQGAPFQLSVSSIRHSNLEGTTKQENVFGQLLKDGLSIKEETVTSPKNQGKWQVTSEEDSSNISIWPRDEKFHTDSAFDLSSRFQEYNDNYLDVLDKSLSRVSGQQNESSMPNELQMHLQNANIGSILSTNLGVDNQTIEEDVNYSSYTNHALSDFSRAEREEGLKKFDSFSRWMSKELEVDDVQMQSSSGVIWSTLESEVVTENSTMSPQVHLDPYLLSPSLSQDQYFSIFDFSPNWAYTGLETKVLVTGKFLKNRDDAQKCKWSCMFGEMEVPAEVLADGVLRCHAPPHTAGRVPFYVTCSNRLACSEVREFEYRLIHTPVKTPDTDNSTTNEMVLRIRLGMLLSLESVSCSNPKHSFSSVGEKPFTSSKINLLLKECDDEWAKMLKLTMYEDFSPDEVKEKLLQNLLKEKLHDWLLHKAGEDGKGPCVLDKEGQGVIHLAAALGYDWALAPTIAAGVSINFRDVHGWTALHWAAYYGRERNVVALVSFGGDPGALTDPTPKFPHGRTAADLASTNGHKGIGGYLAESSLTNHLSCLTIKEVSRDGDLSEVSGTKAVQTISERSATQFSDGDLQDGLSLRDSLTAVRNAAQAAARIHEVFRVYSFNRKQLIEYGDDKIGMSDERALSLVSVKSHRSGLHDEPVHTAAIRIQNKFRGWKGRKEFLLIRQRIVKIQAHVRGHQVRKQFRKVVWSVGIVEKAILRWRRKGTGLRGFRSEGLIEASTMQSGPSKEDDYDFLQVGRKQTEARMEKALARVRSMVQYPEARDQYRRLLTAVTEFQERKVGEIVLNESEEATEGDDLFDLEALLGDDTFMSTPS